MNNFFDFLIGRNKEKIVKNRGNDGDFSARPAGVGRTYGNVRALDLDLQKIKRKTIEFSTVSLLHKINRLTASDLGFSKIAKSVLDTVINEWDYIAISLFVIDKEKQTKYLYLTSSGALGDTKNIFGDCINSCMGKLADNKNFISKAIETKKSYFGNNLKDFLSPEFTCKKGNVERMLAKIKNTIVIPLVAKDKAIGALMINSPREKIESREKIMLSLVSNQIAMAVDNYFLYKNIILQVQSLRDKANDLESLLSLSNMIASGEGIEKSIQEMMDIVPVKLKHLQIVGALMIRTEEQSGRTCAYIITESKLSRKSREILADPILSNYCLFVKDNNIEKYNLTAQSIISGETRMSEKLTDFICPPVGKPSAILIQKIIGAKSIISVPMIVRNSKLGAVIYVFEKPMSEISRRDLNITNAFAQQIGIILENLQFYKNLNKNIEELTRTKQNLESLLSMKNDFLHIVSHQLRTPMTAARGLVSMWQDGDFDRLPTEKMNDVKIRVAENINRLNNIINDMIIAMESEGELKLNFVYTDIEELIKQCIDIYKEMYAKKGLYLKYVSINNIPKVLVDSRYLMHVFMNLIDNAMKYTEKGGLEITSCTRGENISIRFIDTGIGIREDDSGLLFKKFSRGKNSSIVNPGGSGLGLFIAKQIIDNHGGEIYFASLGEKKGATFVVSIPIAQPALKKEDKSNNIVLYPKTKF